MTGDESAIEDPVEADVPVAEEPESALRSYLLTAGIILGIVVVGTSLFVVLWMLLSTTWALLQSVT